MAHAIEGAEAFRGLHDLTGTFVNSFHSDLLACDAFRSHHIRGAKVGGALVPQFLSTCANCQINNSWKDLSIQCPSSGTGGESDGSSSIEDNMSKVGVLL
ncbi:hypothetical protein E4U28_004473 [Claviceps purpurea]|nr:hypothetical protein E4U28_004473 [Claviceps purpurea]